MSGQCMEPTDLSGSKEQKLLQLEGELNADIVALESGCRWANLNEDQLNRLQDAEKDMGVVLLAYNKE